MSLANHRHKNQNRPGFTLVELILAIAITSVLAAVVVVNMAGTKIAAEETKLKVDVNKLNNLISLYVQMEDPSQVRPPPKAWWTN
ncbi:type II secretion system protein [Verrucomicrobium spinosum]|uniref:type II secretion system protein n=1 Tax=Verrucomicrobium spinosum TaxID=2736 RepID=UPI00094644DF|nr:type II secretion system protein [Verrucomicrobium spinosum]